MSGSMKNGGELDCLSGKLDQDIEEIGRRLGGSSDLAVKSLVVSGRYPSALVYLEGLADQALLQTALESLMRVPGDGGESEAVQAGQPPEDLLRRICERVLTTGGSSRVKDFNGLFQSLLSGDSILLVEGQSEAIAAGTGGAEERSVGEPTSQAVVRGPMEGFTENIRTNISQIRRRIRDTGLWSEKYIIGRRTHTEVAVLYMKDIVRPGVLEEVRIRLGSIDIDGILESGYIEEFIQETAFTPFPTVFNTDRPDTAAGALLEGRVVIIVDGTPFVLLVPALFVQFFQSAEDYYQRADISSLLRMVRVISLFISMLLPALYVSLTTYHQEMLPTAMLISLAAQREGVPFPAFVEALLMEFIYEVLREAGVRMPRTVGQAVSIVGTLVIGQAAVDAGIISAAMVIIVSLTAISSFVIPSISMSISVRIIRFGMMILAGSFGLVGIFFGCVLLTVHICSLRSFGVPYSMPFAPAAEDEWQDTILRVPWPRMKRRPTTAVADNRRRLGKRGSKGGGGS
ncbi:spore germination protein [Paenibacillus glufosinatiresistens]|uniref:spore germination protein n=1 Tax=Paenibacillus glufosinatiresistens TaxID=3070657 RepID=UPI00286DF155|nr:spore germination protein [Paenibacillus sp. YX.27]